jgi:hypothetical protein
MYTFMKVYCTPNLFISFHISKLNELKVIHGLHSQCLTQILSKTTSFTEPEGVCFPSLSSLNTTPHQQKAINDMVINRLRLHDEV